MELDIDQWMNISGFLGVAVYLTAHWWRLRLSNYSLYGWNAFLRFLGLTLILIPLFFRWYLSSDQIVTLSVLLGMVAGVKVLRGRTRA